MKNVDTQNYVLVLFLSHLFLPLIMEVILQPFFCRKYIPTDSGYFSWHVINDHAVFQDSYSEVILNIVDLTFNQSLFSDVGRPHSFVNMVTVNYALDPERCCHC